MNEERDKLSTADIASRDRSTTRQEVGADGRTEGGTVQQTEKPRDKISEEHAPGLVESGESPLLPEETTSGFSERWTTIQARFVDEPKDAVGEADELVAEVIQKLAQRFAEERQKLEQQWSSGSDVSTEDLRLALQHYRSFFQRLLAA